VLSWKLEYDQGQLAFVKALLLLLLGLLETLLLLLLEWLTD
jgi:hypothetical protein